MDGTPFVKEGGEWKVNLYVDPPQANPKSESPDETTPNVDAAEEARVRETRQIIDVYCNAVTIYHLNTGQLPDSLEDLTREVKKNGKVVCDPVMRRIVKDPWGNDYHYLILENGNFEILSLGADGLEGGEGYDKDLSSNDEISEQEMG